MHHNKTVFLIDNAEFATSSPYWFTYTAAEAVRNVYRLKVEFLYLDRTDVSSVLINFPKIAHGFWVPYATATKELIDADRSFDIPVSLFDKVEVKLTTSDGNVLPVLPTTNRVVLLLTVYHTVREEVPHFDFQTRSEVETTVLLDDVTPEPTDLIRNVRRIRLLSFTTLDAAVPEKVTLSSKNLGFDFLTFPNQPTKDLYEAYDPGLDFWKVKLLTDPPLTRFSAVFKVTHAVSFGATHKLT
jgi:hypothetical protein